MPQHEVTKTLVQNSWDIFLQVGKVGIRRQLAHFSWFLI